MAINKKLIHFKTKSNFENELANGNILDSSICFIKETKEIWTHGQLYDCSGADTTELLQTINGLSEEVRENEIVAATAISDLYTKINGTSDNGIVTFEKIYPQLIGDAYTYRVTAGTTCVLILRKDFTPTDNTCIEIIFEGVPTIAFDTVNIGDYVGDVSAAKYHILCNHGGLPVYFKVDGVDTTFMMPTGGTAFDLSLGHTFELDALCQKDLSQAISRGGIYGAFAIYT